MSTVNDEIEELREKIPALIRDLIMELSNENEEVALYKPDLLSILAEEEKILLGDPPDLDRLKADNFGMFRIVTDSDFQHTPLGKRFLDLSRIVSVFITKNSES